MAQQKLPANGTQRKSQGPSMSNRVPSRPKQTEYRETKSGHSGRTSSGKAMSGHKAGRGSTC